MLKYSQNTLLGRVIGCVEWDLIKSSYLFIDIQTVFAFQLFTLIISLKSWNELFYGAILSKSIFKIHCKS